jgi:uncharacterized protein
MVDDGLYRRLVAFFAPHKTLPIMPWTGTHPWDLSGTRVLILIAGLAIFGVGDALIIASSIGNAPWSVLAQGISINLGISIGIATVFVGIIVLLLWIPLKRRIGFGTIINIVVISLFIDIGLSFIPLASEFWISVLYVLMGITLVGLGSALYLTCGLGPGPRDGLMTGLHDLSGIRISRIRLSLELMVLTAGALLGGTVGLGTALFALLIGQSIAIWLGVASRSTSR